MGRRAEEQDAVQLKANSFPIRGVDTTFPDIQKPYLCSLSGHSESRRCSILLPCSNLSSERFFVERGERDSFVQINRSSRFVSTSESGIAERMARFG